MITLTKIKKTLVKDDFSDCNTYEELYGKLMCYIKECEKGVKHAADIRKKTLRNVLFRRCENKTKPKKVMKLKLS